MKSTILLFIFLLALISCKKAEKEYPIPEVYIYNPVVLNYDTTLLGGTTEGYNITSFGICYSAHPDPTINDSFVYGTKTYGFNIVGTAFSCDLTQLDPDIKYYIRAFAKQGNIVTYSYEYNFISTPTMVLVEGSSSVKYPLQTSPDIELTSYYISKFEITNDRYCQFINENKRLWGETSIDGKILPQIAVTIMNNPDSKILYNTENNSFYVKPGFENHPVVYLSYGDANVYTELSRCRLPTDAEWQFSAKGGKYSNGYTYAGSFIIDDVAWYNANSNMTTHEVAQKKPNELGIYDMTGNASEWCLDYNSFDSWYFNSRPKKDPCMIFSIEHTSTGDYIFKGGSSLSLDWECASDIRKTPGDNLIGFRLVYSKAKLNYY